MEFQLGDDSSAAGLLTRSDPVRPIPGFPIPISYSSSPLRQWDSGPFWKWHPQSPSVPQTPHLVSPQAPVGIPASLPPACCLFIVPFPPTSLTVRERKRTPPPATCRGWGGGRAGGRGYRSSVNFISPECGGSSGGAPLPREPWDRTGGSRHCRWPVPPQLLNATHSALICPINYT